MPVSSSRRKSAPKSKTANQSKLAFHGSVSKPGLDDTAKKVIDSLEKKPRKSIQPLEASETDTELTVSPAPSPAPTADTITAATTSPTTTTTTPRTALHPPGLSTLELDPTEQKEWHAAITRAKQIKPAQIKSFLAAADTARQAPRQHAEGLSVDERVLADWDVDTRYGPSGAMGRTARWQRAHVRYGMEPPIEVLAVLLRVVENGGVEGPSVMAKGMVEMK